jgi:transposase-like protein
MTIEQVVRKVLIEDRADVIRESVRWVAEEMMEAEVSELVGAELGERQPEDRATHATDTGRGGGTRGRGRSSCRSPSCVRAATSPPF